MASALTDGATDYGGRLSGLETLPMAAGWRDLPFLPYLPHRLTPTKFHPPARSMKGMATLYLRPLSLKDFSALNRAS
ncbi:hypothetical protein COLO4_05133 [Corchorus olitorius]|uniref:Uncharacterized protein n=1 Tax=Corchorus olitorius TaxID=93759 RepID=A0A1R3KRS6_9ROSI|nr:hypothetical protein COLO4_05133 [Corchorus olitorius]